MASRFTCAACEVNPISFCCMCFTRHPSTHPRTDIWIPACVRGNYSGWVLHEVLIHSFTGDICTSYEKMESQPNSPTSGIPGREWMGTLEQSFNKSPSLITSSKNIPQTNFSSVWISHELHNFTLAKRLRKFYSYGWSIFNCIHPVDYFISSMMGVW